MLTVTDAPSVVADQPEFAVSYDNLAVEGTFVGAGPVASPITGPFRIAIGDVLLAKERKRESWHECAVIGIRDDLVTLVWSGLPDSEVFTRRIWQLGFLRMPEPQSC